MNTVLDDSKIKDLFKQAIIEAMEEKQDLVHDLLVGALEDIGMERAIQEGIDSGTVSKDEIFSILSDEA